MNITDTITNQMEITNSPYFMNTTVKTDADIIKDCVIVTKYKIGASIPI